MNKYLYSFCKAHTKLSLMKKLFFVVISCCLSAYSYSLSFNFIPVIIPFVSPETIQAGDVSSAQKPSIYDFDIPYVIRARNKICESAPHSLMRNINPCPMEIFYQSTFANNRKFGAVISRFPGSWSQYPKVLIAGHGDRGYSGVIEPMHRANNEVEQKTIGANLIVKLIEDTLELPKNYNGTIVCESCFSASPQSHHLPLASRLSKKLYRQGYSNLTVEGYIGNIHPMVRPDQLIYILNGFDLDELSDIEGLPDIEDLFMGPEQVQFIGDATGYTRWIFDPAVGKAMPTQHPAARRQFINGVKLFHIDD